MNPPAAPILMYHLVAPTPPAGFAKYTVTPKAFAAQMTWLSLAGYHPIALDDWLQYRRDGSRMPYRPVIITFDDGYQDCFTYAVPILRSHRFPAIFFIVAGLVGKTSRWMADGLKLDLPLMNWDTLAKLRALGLDCGSHTITHPDLSELPIELCRQELSCSRSLLEDHLSCRIKHLAYPFGSYTQPVRDLVESAEYTSACTVHIGLSSASEDSMTLSRVPVNGGESLLDFACRVARSCSATELFHRVRRRLHRNLKFRGRAWDL